MDAPTTSSFRKINFRGPFKDLEIAVAIRNFSQMTWAQAISVPLTLFFQIELRGFFQPRKLCSLCRPWKPNSPFFGDVSLIVDRHVHFCLHCSVSSSVGEDGETLKSNRPFYFLERPFLHHFLSFLVPNKNRFCWAAPISKDENKLFHLPTSRPTVPSIIR